MSNDSFMNSSFSSLGEIKLRQQAARQRREKRAELSRRKKKERTLETFIFSDSFVKSSDLEAKKSLAEMRPHSGVAPVTSPYLPSPSPVLLGIRPFTCPLPTRMICQLEALGVKLGGGKSKAEDYEVKLDELANDSGLELSVDGEGELELCDSCWLETQQVHQFPFQHPLQFTNPLLARMGSMLGMVEGNKEEDQVGQAKVDNLRGLSGDEECVLGASKNCLQGMQQHLLLQPPQQQGEPGGELGLVRVLHLLDEVSGEQRDLLPPALLPEPQGGRGGEGETQVGQVHKPQGEHHWEAALCGLEEQQ